jgi:Fe-S cluster biogenesis protein NfuA
VLYPGLPDHPGHDIATRQMGGRFGGMLSIRVKSGDAAARATAANVALFKRATSLGGVESLIEHRASIEGPSTPVPHDLLRLSIGIEDPQDLIADLEQALTASASAPAASHTTAPPDDGNGEPLGNTVPDQIRHILAANISPLLADRGGDVIFDGFQDDILSLRLDGSPGAALPLQDKIASMIRHYVPQVRHVRFDPKTSGNTSGGPIAAQVQHVLDAQINPSVAAHDGSVTLAKVSDGVAFIAFNGGCQGCAMANVTLRQGVEVLIKKNVPDIIAVEDITDHALGTAPHFKTQKGPE